MYFSIQIEDINAVQTHSEHNKLTQLMKDVVRVEVIISQVQKMQELCNQG